MKEKILVTVKNELSVEERDINVYSKSDNSAHIVSHGSAVIQPLQPGNENDYLHISVVTGPGNVSRETWLTFPGWMDFEFCGEGKLTLRHMEGRNLLKIPPGPPAWQLKVPPPFDCRGIAKQNDIVVGDKEPIFKSTKTNHK